VRPERGIEESARYEFRQTPAAPKLTLASNANSVHSGQKIEVDGNE